MDASGEGKMRNYFSKEMRALKLGGIALEGGDTIGYRIYSFVIIVLLNFSYAVIDFAETFKHDFDVVIDMSIYLFAAILALVKSIAIILNRKAIARALRKLEKPPFTPNLERGGEEEVQLLDKCIRINTVQAITYWTLTCLTICGTCFFTLVLRLRSSNPKDWLLTYGPLTVLNATYSPNFEITWAYQAISVMTFATNYVTIDILMVGILGHISGQFKMLQNAIRRMILNSYRQMQKDITGSIPSVLPEISDIDVSQIPWKYLQKSLKTTVDYHLAILEMADEMENVFSLLLLFIFLGMLTVISFLIYNASQIHNPDQLVRSLGESASAIVEVAAICYWGEQVMIQSQEVGRAAIEVQFVGSDVRFQRALALIIRKSQNPTVLTAAKFTNINLSAFTWVMKTSYSAFMVLRSNSEYGNYIEG